ncbi:hypothetical protein AMTRI_Chr12g234050 [Amborella trichopoda]
MSILSHRWKNIWTGISLVFYPGKFKDHVCRCLQFLQKSGVQVGGYNCYDTISLLLVLNLKNCSIGLSLWYSYQWGSTFRFGFQMCLTLGCCKDIKNIKILGPHTQLQSLKIDELTLGDLEIDAPNLFSFDFTGWPETWDREIAMNLSKLVHIESLCLLGFSFQGKLMQSLFLDEI